MSQLQSKLKELQDLLTKRILVLDGPTGTAIQKYQLSEDDYRGKRFADYAHPLQGNNDLLNITQPQIMTEILDVYLAAGADFVQTNTFNATALPVGAALSNSALGLVGSVAPAEVSSPIK